MTSSEKKIYVDCISEAKNILNIKDTTAIVFDYLIPVSANKNIGIGTSFSDNAQKFIRFLKEFAGINSIQLNPQGILKDNTVSPYSSTNLSIGEHIIDLFKLTENSFGRLLRHKDLRGFLKRENPDEMYKVDYKNLTRQDYKKNADDYVFSNLLKKAFCRFNSLDEKHTLKKEFAEFCKKEDYRLEKEALYYALSEEYGTTQWQDWKDNQDLYIRPNSKKIKQLKKQFKSKIQYHKFVQFIADKQQQESKKLYNSNGIKIYGDIPISFSPAEQWGNKSVFSKNYCYGYSENGKFYDWGSPAPDMDKFQKKKYRKQIKQLFKNRLVSNLKRYDGIRIDAAWELVNPCLVNWSPKKSTGKIVNNINEILIKLVENTAKKIKKESYSPDMLFFELLGEEEIRKAVKYTKNKFLHTLITQSGNATVKGYNEKGYKDGKYTVGIGTHDNPPLVELSKKLNSKDNNERMFIERDIKNLSESMNVSKENIKTEEDYRKYKLTEIFTTERQFINIFDIFGADKYINKWDCNSEEYWKDRLPINYEKLFFKNLLDNKGLNLPEVLYNAIIVKNLNSSEKLDLLKSKLLQFASILKEKGPLTEKEANKMMFN